MTISDRLKDRPRWGEYAIPYTVVVVDGKPDFRVTDTEMWWRCIREKLCAICGGRLDYWVWYVGGGACAEQGLYFDLAMHEECCFYSAAACPFLAEGRDYSHRGTEHVEVAGYVKEVRHDVVKAKVLYASKRRRDQVTVVENGNQGYLVKTGPEIERIQIWPKESDV